MSFRAFAVAAGMLLAAAAEAHSAPAAPPPLAAFGRLPATQHAVLSPSGDRAAYIASIGGARYVLVLEAGKPVLKVRMVDPETPKRQGKAAAAKVRELTWADEDHVIVRVSGTYEVYGDTDEIEQDMVLNLKTHKDFWVFSNASHVYPAVFGYFGSAQRGGKSYGYFGAQAADRDGDVSTYYVDLYEVDLDTSGAKPVVNGKVDQDQWLLDADGSMFASAEYDRKRSLWTLMDSKRRVLAVRKDPYDAPSVLGRGRDPGTLLFRGGEGEGDRYYEVALTGSAEPKRVFDDAGRIHPLYERRTGAMIGYVDADRASRVTLFDPARQKLWNTLRDGFAPLNVELVSYSDDFLRLMVRSDGEGEAGAYWLVDQKSGQVSRFGSLYPELKADAVGARKLVAYKAADGLEMDGILTLPPGREPKRLPVIMLPHGGPAADDGVEFDWWAAALASRGYAVFQPNFRGSLGRGLEFKTAGYGEWGRKMQTDISDGLGELARQGIVDPKRACTMGASYGGYAALAGVTVQQGIYRCAVSVGGVSDPADLLQRSLNAGTDQSVGFRYWSTYMGAHGPNDPLLKTISPVVLARRADAPILLIHGRDDTVVPFLQSQNMQVALKAAGKPVEFVALDGEDHWLSREPTRTAMLEAAMAFVEKNNPPD